MEQLLKVFHNMDLGLFAIGLLILAACLLLTRAIMRLTDRVLKRAKRIDPSLHSMLKTALRILLVFLSILFSLSVMGIPVTSFLALFSVVGLTISLAVQGVLSNLAGGVIILASRPFTLEDYIETEAVSGTVKDIGFLHTRMISPDGKMIFVPNNLLYNSKLINYSSSGLRRIELNVALSYDNSPEQARASALRAVAATQNLLTEPAPQMLLEEYRDSAILYRLQVWTRAENYLPARYALNEALYAAFRADGVQMTYPHLNVHIAGDT